QDAATSQISSSEVFTLLEQFKNILNYSDLPEKEKAVCSIEVAQEEVNTEKPDKEFAIKNLQRTTKVLKEAGETVEAGSSLWKRVKPILVAISPWLGVATNLLM
ncbi:MAG: hypothetical protein AAFY76_19985, partial [Cyanobacteria bacterium J06649_11]